MVNYGLDVVFMTLNIMKLDFIFHIPLIHYKLEGNITILLESINSM